MKPERQKEVDLQLQRKNNCCQVVLGAFCEDLGLSQETMLALTGGFGGGMSLGEKCGAVTAMIMAAGLSFGTFDGTDIQKKNQLKGIVKKLNDRFEESFGSSQCRELLENIGKNKYDLSLVKEQGKRPCAIFMEKACEILEEELEL